MTLVSQGAECILIAKDFIRKHRDDVYLNTLAKQVKQTKPLSMCKPKLLGVV